MSNNIEGGQRGQRAERPQPLRVRVSEVLPSRDKQFSRLKVEAAGRSPFEILVPRGEYTPDSLLDFTRGKRNVDEGYVRGEVTRVTAPVVERGDTHAERKQALEQAVGDFTDDEALERYFGRPEETKGPYVAPEDADEEELRALVSEVVGAGAHAESSEKGPARYEVRIRGNRFAYVSIPGRTDSPPLKLNRALPGDLVRVEVVERKWKGEEQEVAQVVEIIERHPYELVATLRYEMDGEQATLVAYPDSMIAGGMGKMVIPAETLIGTELDETTMLFGFPPEGMKAVLRRASDPADMEWSLSEVIGVAGTARSEVESIARATGVGSQHVEQMTDEDIQAFAKSIEHEAPLLAGRLREVTREQLQGEIKDLERLAEDWKRGRLSTENLTRKLYGLPEKKGLGGPKALVKNPAEYVPGMNRLDMRDWETFTIDPKSAKDFDDAISYRKLPDGGVQVAVHIADVTAFVQQFSALDLVAQYRQMTRYLKAETIPLFPEVIANVLCSLVEGKDRLAYSTIFTFDKSGEQVGEPWFGRAVIRSNKRYAYEGAQQELDSKGKGRHPVLTHLAELAQSYRKVREERAIEFTSKNEVDFEFDASGEPTRALWPERQAANRLIEDWMIRTNEAVVKRIVASNPDEAVAFIRIHRPPEPERIIELIRDLSRMGSRSFKDIWDGKGAYDPHTILQGIRARIDEEPDAFQKAEMELALIRAMTKAGYEVVSASAWDENEPEEDEQHFGLALRWYGHFTSPIRRYPDMIQHRLLEMALRSDPVTIHHEGTTAELMELAGIADMRELAYNKAERDVRSFLLLSLMQKELRRNGPQVRATIQARDSQSITLRMPLGEAYLDQRITLKDIVSSVDRTPEELWGALEPGRSFTITPEIDLPLRRMKVRIDLEGAFAEADVGVLAELPVGSDLVIHPVTTTGEEPMVGIRDWKKGQKSRSLIARIGAKRIVMLDAGGQVIEPKDWGILGVDGAFRVRLRRAVVAGDKDIQVTFVHPLGERSAPKKAPPKGAPRSAKKPATPRAPGATKRRPRTAK